MEWSRGGPLPGDSPALMAKAHLLERLPAFWLWCHDTSLEEPLFAFSLPARAHWNMGICRFFFFCSLSSFFSFPGDILSQLRVRPDELRARCDQHVSQGHRFGIKAESDFPAFRDKAELGPWPRWQEGERGQENQGCSCCGLASNDENQLKKA